MKKNLFGILTLFSVCLFGQWEQVSTEPQLNQFQSMMQYQGLYLYNAVTFCEKEGYSFFKLKKFSFADKYENSIEISGKSISKDFNEHEITVDDAVKVTVYCYKEKPEDQDAIDVIAMSEIFKQFNPSEEEQTQTDEPENILTISTKEELDELLASKGQKLYIDVYSTDCPPCKMLAPKYHAWAEENADTARFAKVNIDDSRELADHFSIRGVPTMLVFDEEGDLEEKVVGLPDILKIMKVD